MEVQSVSRGRWGRSHGEGGTVGCTQGRGAGDMQYRIPSQAPVCRRKKVSSKMTPSLSVLCVRARACMPMCVRVLCVCVCMLHECVHVF